MKIKIILIAAMLAFSALAQAQVSNEQFSTAVDYVNCKYVELSLKKSQTQGVTAVFQSKCNCEDHPDFNAIKNAIAQTETKTIELSAEIDKIKANEFKANMKIDDAIKILTDGIFNNQTKYSKLFDFATRRKDDNNFTITKSEIKKNLTTLLSATASEVSKNQTQPQDTQTQAVTPTIDERVTALESQRQTKVEDKGWFDGFTFQIDIFAIIISIILFVVAIRMFSGGSSDYDDGVPNKIKNYVADKISRADFGKGNLGVNYSDIKNLKDEINNLRNEIKLLRGQVESNKIPMEIVQPKYEEQSYQEIKQPDVKIETFFLSTPNSDGSFSVDAATSQYKESASIYKFTKINPSRVEFEIDTRETSVKLALQYPELRIDPCCIPQNAFNSKAKRIRTSKKGTAELNGELWELKSKAEIYYES